MSLFEDRRALRIHLLGSEAVVPPLPDAEGPSMTFSLLLPRARAVYVPALLPWPEDTEPLVHNTRVASRRLVEALAMLKPALPAKPIIRTQGRAKMLRRALGQAREADVLVADFRKLAVEAGWGDDAIHALDAIAEAGRGALAEAKSTYTPERLLRHGLDVLALCRMACDLPLRAVAGPHLYERADAVLRGLASLKNPKASPDHHRLRVKFKALRYTIEILGRSFLEGWDAKAFLAQMKSSQDALGVLNDADDLLTWLKRRPVRRKLSPERWEEIQELAAESKRIRYQQARDIILEQAPPTLRELRRIAGRIGPLL